VPFIGGQTEYLSPQGEKLTVEMLGFESGSDAYSFLTLIAQRVRAEDPNARVESSGIGTASVRSPRGLAFLRARLLSELQRRTLTRKISMGPLF